MRPPRSTGHHTSAKLVIGKKVGGRVVVLEPNRVYQIGRGPNEDIHIWDPLVSRHHASLREQAGRWILTDDGSRNGMYLDKRRVALIDLYDGLEFQIANTQIRFEKSEIPHTHNIKALREKPPPKGAGDWLAFWARSVKRRLIALLKKAK